MVKFIYLAIFMFLSTGCFEYPIYKEKKVEFTEKIECLSITSLLESDIEVAQEHLNFSKNCKYELVLKSHIIRDCNNPQVKSLGSDIDGYVSLKLVLENETIFRSQTDFKGDNYIPHLKRLLLDFKTLENLDLLIKK